MKKAFDIYKRDIKAILNNYSALIVVIALCILPSLYAWFNIEASWDPYSQEATSGIKIGVVNKDNGTILNGKEINIGNEVIEQLKDNKQMGWQFVSEDVAEQSIREGKYYATLTIPEKFSEELTSIVTEDIKKGEIIYTVNEKINAVAPKITDKGATGVQENVTKTIVETVSNAIFGVGNELGIELENQIPKISTVYNALLEIQSSFDTINKTSELAYEGTIKLQDLIKEINKDMPLIKDTLINAQNLSKDLSEFLEGSKQAVNNIAPTIKQDIKIISEISDEVSQNVDALINAINSGSDKAPEIIDNLILKVDSLNTMTDSLIRVLESLNKFAPGKPLTGLIEQLTTVSGYLDSANSTLVTIKSQITSGKNPDLTVLNGVSKISKDIHNIAEDIYGRFDSEIMLALTGIIDEAHGVADNAIVILKEAEAKLPQAQDILSIALESASKGEEGLAYIKEALPKLEETINDLVDKLSKINNNADLQEIVNLLKVDVATRSDFLANPVNVTENKLFPMENYGTGMTPFYSVLSLWVGILLLSSILGVEAKGDYTATQVYFGKLLLFSTITAIQGLIVALGDLYLLKIYCVNPILFILGIVFASITFTVIVYSLVSVFGNVGKVIAIILMVLQVAGSGGTFPIQLTPKFFQVINPFLPFTYSISFAREAIGGVVTSVLARDIIVSLIYIIIFIIIGVILKKPINKLLKGFVEKFEESELGEN